MAKNNITSPLTFIDIVLNADAEVIKQAYEARLKIDALLAEREEAYRRINELEMQIEEVVGEDSVFPFPPPPVPIAGFGKPIPATRAKDTPRKSNRKFDHAPSADMRKESAPTSPDSSSKGSSSDSASAKPHINPEN